VNRISTNRNAYDLGRLLALAETRSDGWFILVQQRDSAGAFLQDLLDEISVQSSRSRRIVQAATMSPDDLVQALEEPSGDVVLVEGLEQWDQEALASLDVGRSRLARAAPVVLLFSAEGLVRFRRLAPNLFSWIGGRVAMAHADEGLMRDPERLARLKDLAEHYQVVDAEVIRMAEAGELPAEPHFAEWLILLGREDLARQLGKRES
jgi:hypothetical protein